MSSGLAWIILFIAGLCEVGWAVGMKYTDGFSRLWPSVWTVAGMVASVILLAWSLKVNDFNVQLVESNDQFKLLTINW